jgi:hypothetical protein
MSKYGNIKTVLDGIRFDSKAEAARYQELRLLECAGEIANLSLQPTFILQDKFTIEKRTISAITYTADFMYEENGTVVVEDVKGVETAVFKMKEKLFLKKYPQFKFLKT